MKIISKHKDYYDYLQGIYGIDEKLTYDRRTNTLVKYEKENPTINGYSLHTYEFTITNSLYMIYSYKDKFYHTVDELMELNRLLVKDDKTPIVSSWRWRNGVKRDYERHWERYNHPTNINKKERQPVLVKVKHYNDDSWCIPDLSTFDWPKRIPAEEMYQKVSAFMGWLVDNPPIPDNMTNKEKINSHGFDMKKSFRHRK
jgi:hypothetical protein